MVTVIKISGHSCTPGKALTMLGLSSSRMEQETYLTYIYWTGFPGYQHIYSKYLLTNTHHKEH